MWFSKRSPTKLVLFGVLVAASLVTAGWFHKYEKALGWFAGAGACASGSCVAFANNQNVGGFLGILLTIYSVTVGGGLAHEIKTGTAKRDLWHGLLSDHLNATTSLVSGHDDLAHFLLGRASAKVNHDGYDFDLYRDNGIIQIVSNDPSGRRDGDTLAAAIDETSDHGWPAYDSDQREAMAFITTSVLNSHSDETGFCLRISDEAAGSTVYAHVISVSNFGGQVAGICQDNSLY